VAVFSEIVGATRGIDLPVVVSYIWGVLSEEGDDPMSHSAIQSVFTRTTEQLSLEIADRSTELAALEVEVLVSSLMNGIAVVSKHWIALTGATVDDASRALWNELFDRLVTTVRTGYSSSH
jgi:hypothetical protein